MTLALRKAIYARWNAVGLNSSVAPLFPGEREAAPEGIPLPRAQYSLTGDTERTRSRGSRELIQDVRFQVWGSGDGLVQQYLDSIEAAFVDAESAMLNPIAVEEEEGAILSVDYFGKNLLQETASVFQGVLSLQIQWCRPVTV